MKTLVWTVAIIVAVWIGWVVAASAQEVYRPMLVKETENGYGPLCFTSKDIAAAANFFAQFGISWIAEPNAMTVMQGKTKIEVGFAQDGCAASAKLVR
jgi:hypothetical protein